MMPIFLAEIGKKSFLLSAPTIAKATEVICFYHKDKTIRISESSLPETLKFKIAGSSIATSTKVKDTVVHFTTDSNISGKVDIAMLPIERV